MNLNGRPRHAPWVEAEPIENDCIQFSVEYGRKKVELNQTSSLIWSLCDGQKTVNELLEFFANAYPEHAAIKQEVSNLIEDLSENRLIVFDGGADALEYQGEVVRKLNPDTELQWQLEQIRQFLFGVLRVEEAEGLDSDLDVLLGGEAFKNAKNLDVDSASMINDSCVIPYRGAMQSPSFKACLNNVISSLKKMIPEVESKIEVSGHAIYLKGAHMGWHSNHSRSDGRVYCSWAQKPNTNFFRYQHPMTGEIVTEWEDPGWNIKSFTIPPNTTRFWHCIGAGSLRLSLGFRYNLPK